MAAVSAATDAAPPVLVHHVVDVYFELCTRYKVQPSPPVTIALRFPDVTYLQLDASFGPADLLPLAELLRGGVDMGVTTLDMRRCEIGNAGCYVLQHAFESPSCPIRSLILSYNDIGEHGAIALARALWRNRVLERVDLRGNRIGVAGAVALAHVIRASPSLRYLDVSQNNLRIRGVQELHQALQERARKAQRRLARGRGNGAPQLRQVRRGAEAPEDGAPRSEPVPASDGIRRRAGGGGDGGRGSAAGSPGSRGRGGRGPDADGAGDAEDSGEDGEDAGGGDFEFEVDDEGGVVGDGEAAGDVLEGIAGRLRGGDGGDGGAVRAPSRAVRQAVEGLLDPHLEWDLSQGRVGAEGIRVRWAGNLVNQEITHSIIHGVGLVMAVVGAVPLLQRAQGESAAHLVADIVYACGLIIFYVMATLRHSLFFLESTSRTLRALDHMSIYLLIASTYTPFLLVNLGHTWVGLTTLAGMWTAAAIGALAAWYSGDRVTRFKMIMYMGMGWAGMVTARPVMSCVDTNGVYLLVGGGAIYSLGFVFYTVGKSTPTTSRWRWAWYALAVIASTLHYFAVFFHVGHNPECAKSIFW